MKSKNKREKLMRAKEANNRMKICMMNASSGKVTIFTCKKNANPENAVIQRCMKMGGNMGDIEWRVIKKLKHHDGLILTTYNSL